MKKNNTFSKLIFSLFLSLLSGCTKEWKNPDTFMPPEKKRYCYQSIGKVTCYHEPQKCYGKELVGYVGPPPSRKKIQ